MVANSIYILDPKASGALTASGNAALTVPGVLAVASTSASAVTAGGNARISAASLQMVGGVQAGGNAAVSPAAVIKVATVADPMAGLSGPSTNGLTSYGSVSFSSGSHTLCPGIYARISASGTATLTLRPGVYIIEGGGLTVTGNASLSGTEVTIFNAGSAYPSTGGRSAVSPSAAAAPAP